MNATRSAIIVLFVTTALAVGAPVRAAEEPPTIITSLNFSDFIMSCCSQCTESAEKLCGSGHVKDYDCGGWPCECSFNCDTKYLIPSALSLEP